MKAIGAKLVIEKGYTTKNGIVKGVVKGVGKDVQEVSTGNTVYFGEYSGQKLEDYLLVNESQILAFYE